MKKLFKIVFVFVFFFVLLVSKNYSKAVFSDIDNLKQNISDFLDYRIVKYDTEKIGNLFPKEFFKNKSNVAEDVLDYLDKYDELKVKMFRKNKMSLRVLNSKTDFKEEYKDGNLLIHVNRFYELENIFRGVADITHEYASFKYTFVFDKNNSLIDCKFYDKEANTFFGNLKKMYNIRIKNSLFYFLTTKYIFEF